MDSDCHTLVIDDARARGSSDGTWPIASAHSPVARLPQNLDIGGAVQTGIKYAARNNYDFRIQIDGDGQHNPFDVVVLLDAYRK